MKRLFGLVFFLTCFFFAVGTTAKPHPTLKPLMKKGTTWVFERTLTEPGAEPQVVKEKWKVESIETLGKDTYQVTIVIEVMKEPYAQFDEAEYIIQGSRLYDVSWLERTRPTEYIEMANLKNHLPLFDAKKASSRAQVMRYPDDALAFIRYEKLAKFKANNGKTYKGVIAAIRNRGETDPTDMWWFHARHGIIQLELHFPGAGGGGKMTWKRLK